MKVSLLSCAIASLALAGCNGLYGNDEAQRYTQRSDTITLSAGDAPNVNARTHMISPWPRGVGDRHIYSDGPRMVRAVDRYRRARTDVQSSGGSGSDQSGAAAAPSASKP